MCRSKGSQTKFKPDEERRFTQVMNQTLCRTLPGHNFSALRQSVWGFGGSMINLWF